MPSAQPTAHGQGAAGTCGFPSPSPPLPWRDISRSRRGRWEVVRSADWSQTLPLPSRPAGTCPHHTLPPVLAGDSGLARRSEDGGDSAGVPGGSPRTTERSRGCRPPGWPPEGAQGLWTDYTGVRWGAAEARGMNITKTFNPNSQARFVWFIANYEFQNHYRSPASTQSRALQGQKPVTDQARQPS